MLQVSVCTDNTTCLLQINHRGMQLYSDSTVLDSALVPRGAFG